MDIATATSRLKASARSDVPPFFVMEMMQATAEMEAAGRPVIHLEVGQPSTAAPSKVLAAAEAALRADKIGYTVALGLAQLRERIAGHYRQFYGLDIPSDRVVVTTGSSGGFVLAFLAAFDVGDRVAMGSPGYPCYRNILAALGITAVDIPTSMETRYQVTPELLDALEEPIDGLVIAGPANPTGTMIPRPEMMRLVDYCRTRGIRIISDEIYHGITFTQPAVSVLEHWSDAIVMNSFSKYFSMTGWRLGWLVLPEDLVRRVERLAQNLFLAPPTLAQIAACAAFDCYDEVNAHVARYARNRNILLEELPKAGLEHIAPADGAFFLYCDVGHLTDDSQAFCRRLLAETGVATSPGIDFDLRRGRHTIRLSTGGTTEEIAEAARRLRHWLPQA